MTSNGGGGVGEGGKAENGKTSEREDGKAVASVVSDPKREVGIRGTQPNLQTVQSDAIAHCRLFVALVSLLCYTYT